MNTHTATVLAVALLLAGATAPSLAATHPAMAKPSKTSSATQALTLTKAQRQAAWKDLHSAAITEAPSPKIAARVGAKVPGSIPMMGMSSKAAQAVPKLKSYDYTMAKGKLLIVSPKSRKIVDVISG